MDFCPELVPLELVFRILLIIYHSILLAIFCLAKKSSSRVAGTMFARSSSVPSVPI